MAIPMQPHFKLVLAASNIPKETGPSLSHQFWQGPVLRQQDTVDPLGRDDRAALRDPRPAVFPALAPPSKGIQPNGPDGAGS